MGADARWVCHTCKTVCSRGGRPIFQTTPGGLVASSISHYKDILARFYENFEFDDHKRYIDFLDDLRKWLGRHELHNIHIGSDYSTDMMDLDDYYEETVDGKVSKITRHEARLQCVEAFEESSLMEIGKVIEGKATTKEKARELYNRFSMGDL